MKFLIVNGPNINMLGIREPDIYGTLTYEGLLEYLKGEALPAAEVHLSDVTKRESFRQISYAGMACKYHFIGLGKEGYVRGMEALLADGQNRDEGEKQS